MFSYSPDREKLNNILSYVLKIPFYPTIYDCNFKDNLKSLPFEINREHLASLGKIYEIFGEKLPEIVYTDIKCIEDIIDWVCNKKTKFDNNKKFTFEDMIEFFENKRQNAPIQKHSFTINDKDYTHDIIFEYMRDNFPWLSLEVCCFIYDEAFRTTNKFNNYIEVLIYIRKQCQFILDLNKKIRK